MIEISEYQKIERAEKEVITSLLADHLQNGDAIGLWRLPDSKQKQLIICTDGVSSLDEIVIEDLGSGFAFSPFDGQKKIFIKANISYTIENGEIVYNTQYSETLKKGSFDGGSNSPKKPNFYDVGIAEKSNDDHQHYIELVKKSILQIESGQFEKLVPARCKKISLSNDFDLVDAFNRLCSLYPTAFVSLVSSSATGTWIGASPELLVSVDDRMHFRTAAVAGTQKFNPETDIRQVAWTQKEIEEQALVSRYIINCFKKIRLREFEEHGPKTWRAGNLLHLKTDFEVDMASTNFLQLGTVMLKLLHPTSAVCGMPCEESLAFLKKNEGFDRSFYSGYLGPVNHASQTHLYVNLRCMQWSKTGALLFAGAGITRDSIPEKEWEETEMKINTLLQVIQS